MRRPAAHARVLQRAGIPVVFCHRRVAGVSAPWLAIPFEQVGERAGAELAALGHEHALFVVPQMAPTAAAYLAGFRRAFRGRVTEAPPLSGGAFDPHDMTRWEPAVEQVAADLFRAADRPTAVFTTFDPIAELVYLALARTGLKVPADVSVIGVGGTQRRGSRR